ncbi:hypothetical protein F5X98DRAFT_356138 [Xylaria grammica]|nr:hypothetical protein F5X98DRAFT_356138 [Xylaria grammica]
MTTTGRTEALRDFVREVISAIRDVDEHVLSSDYIKHHVLELENGAEPVGFDYSDPEAHFEDFDDIRFWEKYFSFVLREWNLDQHGERMGNSELNFLIERLTAPATQLDHYGPLLMAEYEKVPNAPAKRAQGISKRMAVLNGFLNSAEVALEVYYKKRNVKPTLRQRRPVRDADTTESGQQPDDTESSTPEPEARENSPRRKLLRKLFSGFTNNSTLITFVALFTIASAILSAYGYSVAIRTPKDLGWDSPEFYNALQSALMQLLGLYVTIQPALRHRNLQRSYSHWSWWLAGLGAIAPILAIGYFRRGPDASQLVLFVGSAIQSTIILQLIWAVDNLQRKQK